MERSGNPAQRGCRVLQSFVAAINHLFRKGGSMLQVKKIMAIGIAVAVVMIMVAPVWAADSGKINLNTATVKELAQLKRIGTKYAERIVKYREDNGSFKTADELIKVPGIGVKTLELNKDRIVVE
jgi:competence protein ComEA